MKNLSKLCVNPEKLMKKEELIALKGGTNCWCFYSQTHTLCGVTGTASSSNECSYMCAVQGCGQSSYGGY